jgi:hypothetical protein
MLNGPVQLLMLPAPQPASEEPQIPEVDHTAALLELRNAAIQHALQETLGYLGMLGAEVFEQPPYSRFYDDWMGNLRQTIYSFQTHWAINADEAFFTQTNRILEALAAQLLKLVDAEAQSDAQAKALLENRTLLSSLDAGYAAKTEQFVARGKSMLERLLHNAQTLESELAAVKQIKVDLRHPLQLLAKEQKTESLGQRLDAARRRLAYAVSAAAVNPAKAEKLNPQWGTQSCELEKKREAALAYLRGNVSELQAQIEEVKARRTSNPVRKVANQQQIYEFSYQLYHAQKRLEVAEKTCSYELDYLKSQYENQKQTALSNVQTLERDLQAKPADASQVRRMEAAKALSELVKAYAAQKTTLPLQNREPKTV